MSRKTLLFFKWHLYCLFSILLALKAQHIILQIPWAAIFLPVILSDISGIYQKVAECRGFSKALCDGSKAIVFKQIAGCIDQVGSLLSIIGLCVLLEFVGDRSLFTRGMEYFSRFLLPLCLLPLWGSILVSTSLRLYVVTSMREDVKRTLTLSSSVRPSGFYFNLSNMILQLIFRGLSPLLVTLRLSGTINDWSIAFTPLWILMFMGMPLGMFTIARAPTAHHNGSRDLQKHASQYMFAVGAHIILLDLAMLVSFIWLTQWLSTRSLHIKSSGFGNKDGFPAFFILSPLIVALAAFAMMRPMLLENAKNYQAYVRGRHHQDGQQALAAASKRQAVLIVITEKTLLLQTSPTLYTRLDPSLRTAALDHRILLTAPQDSDLLLLGSDFEDFVGVAYVACFGRTVQSPGGWVHGESLRGRSRYCTNGQTDWSTGVEGGAGEGESWGVSGERVENSSVGVGSHGQETEMGLELPVLTGHEMAAMRRQSAIDRVQYMERARSAASLGAHSAASTLLSSQSPSASTVTAPLSRPVSLALSQLSQPLDGQAVRVLSTSSVESSVSRSLVLLRRSDEPYGSLSAAQRGREAREIGGEGDERSAEREESAVQGGTYRRLDFVEDTTSSSSSVLCPSKCTARGLCVQDEGTDTDNLCVICFSRMADACLLECGHMVLCFFCASLVARQVPNSCPLCRVPIRHVVRITTTLPSDPKSLHGRCVAVSGEGYSVNTDIVRMFSNLRAAREVARQV